MSDHDDLRDFLRAEGLDDGSGLQQAVDDPLLAVAGERALAQVLARRQAAHQRRRLVGVLAAAAVSATLAAGAAGHLLHPVSPAGPDLSAAPTSPVEESLLAPLTFTAHPAPVGPALEELAQASSGYAWSPLRSARARASWYEWNASTPQDARLVDVTPRGDGSQVRTFQMPAPQDGRIQVADRGALLATSYVGTAPSAETAVADALAVTSETRCAGELSACGPDASPVPGTPAATSSPALQALATLPHAQAVGTTKDRLGRPALGFAADLGSSQKIVVLSDPDTGAFLGAEWIDDQPTPHVTRILAAEPRS